MKSIKRFAYVSAIALVGMGFAACNNNDPEKTTGNDIYNGETVKTQFMVSIAENVSSTAKKMRSAEVQSAGDRASFRGMDSICIIPFADDLTARIGKNITLTAIDKTSGTNYGEMNAKNSVIYEDVAIPLGTKSFLFYGKAIDNTAGVAITTDTDKHKFGIVTANNLYGASQQPANITFSLNSIYAESTFPEKATKLAEYVTSIANAKDASDNTWAEHSNTAVKELYTKFITLTAGSSFSILATVTDLYNTLERFQATQVTPDAVVTAVMEAIKTKATVNDGTEDFNHTLTLNTDLSGYPASISLPEGAAKIAWNTDKFEVAAIDSIGQLHKEGSLQKFVYPASLQYYGASTIKTSKSSKKSLYDGSNEWSAIIDDANYEEGVEVKSTTKSVAIKDPINYGVGQLRTTIKRNATLKDNIDSVYTITNPLKWTAVLVGGQKTVMYDFTQNESATDVYTIYDNYLPTDGGVEIGETASEPNYTLVFSTKDNTSKDDGVYIAIELENTNATFFGKGGQIIPAGSKFYLVGELKVTGDPANHPEKYNIFYKDYYTTANLTITSLANAYNTIPDLRSEGLELGFAVNLEWQEGLTFDVDL